ncbi:glycoside hydrolase 68 family protein [Acrocarpospora phusangensis]|uniref:Glycoside hydrolase 68 family protein n=1 Tax=Acrocarpospora phusangensis TaxID=1070424 RepID=A0A919QJ47_9ACTN|nr:glycoside hydrolase family 68 protein [Acrocarpospora phusangensis]GIH28380.1 glycoside hydrolase 68 family protein [Acrocarpospora phusangensis]
MTQAQPARWTRHHLDLIADDPATTAPLILGTPERLLDLDVWDMWPIQEEDGSTSVILGDEVWMGLTAPAVGHPEERHDVARIRLMAKTGTGWRDLGNVFADGVSPGSREWSGSAIRRQDGTILVFYTAAGSRGEEPRTFLQRVVESRMALVADGDRVALEETSGHRELVRPDGHTYVPADEIRGGPGQIRAWRDPAWFRDPADGRAHLLIAASVPWGDRYMGAVALAGEDGEGWSLRAPLLTADGVNREIERPHIVFHDSSYYLFFCTQRQSFEPVGAAPTGLYGFVAPRLAGPYEPVNGSGLVIGNPAGQPDQAYAWVVLDDLRAVSFLNYRNDGPEKTARAAFGGTIAPVLRLTLDGAKSRVEVV